MDGGNRTHVLFSPSRLSLSVASVASVARCRAHRPEGSNSASSSRSSASSFETRPELPGGYRKYTACYAIQLVIGACKRREGSPPTWPSSGPRW